MKRLPVALLTIVALGCGSLVAPTLQSEMRSAYKDVRKLYNYVWDPEQFYESSNERDILSLLQRLSKGFHKVDQMTQGYQEPGYRLTLKFNDDLLNDIRTRFAEGKKEYAHWKLKSLGDTCISCHTRFKASADFIGDEPTITTDTWSSKLARAEFLIASRQFDKASEELFMFARDMSVSPLTSTRAFQALKLWLLVEVRVKNRFASAAQQLENMAGHGRFNSDHISIMKQWVKDLRVFADRESKGDNLQEAKFLMVPVKVSKTIPEDEYHLVRALRASSLLHIYLSQGNLTHEQQKEATFELATAYSHIQLDNLDVFRDLYFEQVIRSYPGTPEAQTAFKLYKEDMEFEFSGSGGLHLDDSISSKMKELESLANQK